MDNAGAGLVDWLRRRLAPTPQHLSLDTAEQAPVTTTPLRLALDSAPFRLTMGAQCLDVNVDALLASGGTTTGAVVVTNPAQSGQMPRAVLRVDPGTEVKLDPDQRNQHGLYTAPREVHRRRPRLTHEGDFLVLRTAVADPPTVLSHPPAAEAESVAASREATLAALTEVYGQRFEPLSPEEALATLRAVIAGMEDNADLQPKDSNGDPGALLVLPEGRQLILAGDIHGRVDNLLTLLTRNDYLAAIEAGEAVLVFLGDLVHHDHPAHLSEMDSSMLALDILLRLKQRYPRGVFLLMGNHDGFSDEIMKGGVPQGLLWDSAVRTRRGDAYREALGRFYAISPLVMRGYGCVACHAGPPTMAVTRDDLVDAHRSAPLVHDLTWIRCAGPGVTHGYRARDVRHLRRVLDLPGDADMIVGHFPRSKSQTIWMDTDHIASHHVLFSAQDQIVGAMQSCAGRLVPQVFPVEPLQHIAANGSVRRAAEA